MKSAFLRIWASLVASLGALVFGIGTTSIVGYIFDVTGLHTWDGSIAMAMNTAVALMATGIALVIISVREFLP